MRPIAVRLVATRVADVLRRGGLPGGAGDLACRRVEPVPEVDIGDGQQERGQLHFVVVSRGVIPDIVGHWVDSIAQPGDGLGQRERGALCVGEER